MKRKLIAVITVLTLCLSLLIPSASVFAETELPYWDKAVTIEGRTLTLTITSKNAAGVLGGGVIELKYDPDVLEFKNTSKTGLSDSTNICGVVNGLSDLNTFIANFASAKSFTEDRTLVIATFEIKDGKTCTGNPFTVVRDRLIDSGDGTSARPVKQVNIDSDGNLISPTVRFSCSHSTLTDWEITKRPTYTEEGEQVRRCTVCNKIVEKTVLSILSQYGDVNANGVVDSNDAILVLRYDAKALDELNESQKLAANVDGSAAVDANDAILILRYDAKAITKFPVEEKKIG